MWHCDFSCFFTQLRFICMWNGSGGFFLTFCLYVLISGLNTAVSSLPRQHSTVINLKIRETRDWKRLLETVKSTLLFRARSLSVGGSGLSPVGFWVSSLTAYLTTFPWSIFFLLKWHFLYFSLCQRASLRRVSLYFPLYAWIRFPWSFLIMRLLRIVPNTFACVHLPHWVPVLPIFSWVVLLLVWIFLSLSLLSLSSLLLSSHPFPAGKSRSYWMNSRSKCDCSHFLKQMIC